MSKAKKYVMAPRAVPIQRTDLSTFDDSFSFLKEKFTAEMQRMDEEMNKFSVNLMTLYGQQGSTPQPRQASGVQPTPTWDALANSPLIQGEGTDKVLKLQFDLSTFDPTDVRVELLGDTLIVYAHHEHKTDNSAATREFKREFVLPRGIDTENIISSISRDGVLTVQAPLPPLVPASTTKKVLSKANQEHKASKKRSVDKNLKGEDQLKIPRALTMQVPQEPLSTTSPASPATLPTSPTTPVSGISPTSPTNALSPTSPTSVVSPTVQTPQKTSKTPSKMVK